MAYRGDLIDCLVDFNHQFARRRAYDLVPILFTLNGTLIHKTYMKYEERPEKELYPFIGMCHKGIRVLAKVRAIFIQYFGIH